MNILAPCSLFFVLSLFVCPLRRILSGLRSLRFLRLPSVGLQTPETGLPAPSGLSGPTGLSVPKALTVLRDLMDLSLSGGLLVFQIRCKDNIKTILVFLQR